MRTRDAVPDRRGSGGAKVKMPVGAEASAYLSAVKWSDEGLYLREYVQRMALPQVARVIKGQYMNLGVPSLPSPSLNQIVFLSAGGTRVKVAAQCVKFKEGRRVVPVGPKLAIPDNYNGWFEILSEDGRAVRCMESVAELARRFPHSCVVRESLKGYAAKLDDPDSPSDKSRTIPAGEILVLVGEVASGTASGNSSERSKSSKLSSASGRYLRCLTSKGETMYLTLEQRGKFSPVAREDNISGVHSIRNLLTKRLPLMVRLVHGRPPQAGSKFTFLPEMRLYSLFEEDCVMALPLLKDTQNMVALPLSAALKLQAPRNVETLIKLREYATLGEKSTTLMQENSDQIQVFDIAMSKELRNDLKNNNFPPPRLGAFCSRRVAPPAALHLVQRSLSEPNPATGPSTPVPKVERETVSATTSPAVEEKPSVIPSVESYPSQHDICYDEIDQIYDYVRGFAPLPEKIKSDFLEEPSAEQGPMVTSQTQAVTVVSPPAVQTTSGPHQQSSATTTAVTSTAVTTTATTTTTTVTSTTPDPVSSPAPTNQGEESKPEPPPIETIPARRASTGDAPVKVLQIPAPNKRPSKKKDALLMITRNTEEHIYEKVNKRNDNINNNNNNNSSSNHNNNLNNRVPIRSNSASKIYQPYSPYNSSCGGGGVNHVTTKLFVKSPVQQRTQTRARFFRHFGRGNSVGKDPPATVTVKNGGLPAAPKTYRSLTTSPIFNIRYKSLTNLALDFDTLDSSHSGGQTSSGSAGSKEVQMRPELKSKRSKLPRPKSLTNLLWEMNQVDNHNKYNLMQNELNAKAEPRKFIFTDKTVNNSNLGCQNKRIGTLYL